jgi:hypothetical protein
MRTFLYRCPNTKLNVQGHVKSEAAGPDHYVAQQCPICAQVHLVNPSTGKLPSEAYAARKDPKERLV